MRFAVPSKWSSPIAMRLAHLPAIRSQWTRQPSFRPMRHLTSSTSTSTPPKESIRGWRRYAAQFRNAPAAHITSFAILHELTAILPFPLIYLTLDALDFELPIPEDTRSQGDQFARRLLQRYGWLDKDTAATEKEQSMAVYDGSEGGSLVGATSRVFVNIAVTYAIVKALMPVRIAASVAMTPWFSRVAISPAFRWIGRLRGQ